MEKFTLNNLAAIFFKLGAMMLIHFVSIAVSIVVMVKVTDLPLSFAVFLGSLGGFILPIIYAISDEDLFPYNLRSGVTEKYGRNAIITLVVFVVALIWTLTGIDSAVSEHVLTYEIPKEIIKTKNSMVFVTDEETYTTSEMVYSNADSVFVCHESFRNSFTAKIERMPRLCVKEK
jgi:hypothetical protein